MAEQGPLQAFRTEVVVDGFPRKIETLCLWGEQLLAGLQEGSLLFFKRLSAQPPASTPSGGADAQPDTTASWQVVDAHRDVERKAVLQMLAISVSDHTLSPMPSFAPLKASASGGSLDGKAQQQQQQQQQLQQQQKQQQQPAEDVQGPRASQLLLSLTVDGVNVHSLPNARLRCQGLRTKGATCFAWHAPTRTVAVAVKKRLLLFKLVVSEGRKGGGVSKGSVDLEEAADLAMPEAMNTITFAGPHLFLGSRKQYYLMANVLSALAPTPSPSAPAAETAAAASAAKAAAAALTAVSVGSVGTALAPAIAVCPSVEEVLLACDNMAAFVSFSGAPSRRSSLAFKEPLQALVATDFYVVGLMAAGAEVHSLRRTGDATVSQFMPELQGARLVALPGMSPVDGSIFAAMSGDRGIRRLVPIPLETQAELLATAGEYQEALALAALAASRTPAQSQRQQQEERPRALLTSPQGSWHPVVSETSEDQSQQGGGTNILEDRLRLLYGNHLFASGAWDEGAAQLALCSGRVTGMTGAPLLLLRLLPSLVPESWRTALPDHAAGTPLLKVTEPTGPSFAAAAATLLPYLMSYRTRIIAALQASQSGGNASTTSTTNSSKSVDSPRAAANGTQGSEVAEACIRTLSIIDVAVVAILLAQPEDTGALLRFVQQPRHWIDLEEGEKLLTSSGYYAELAALYKHYSKHKQGLELLYRTSQRPETLNPPARGAAADLPGLPGVWATVRYLVKLGGMNREEAIPLIKRHAKWVLEADPDAGLQAFLEMQPPLDPSTVLSILHQHSPHYCSMYLEAALQLGVALPQDYHSELLLIYLQEILSKDEDALQTLKGPYGSSQELTEEEASSSGEDAESYGNGTASEQISISKWARSKSAAVRTNTDLLFPLDHSQQSKRTNPISIAPRQGVNSRISYDADHGGKPRSLNALEAMKAGQQAPGPSRFDGGGLPPLPSRHTFDPPQQGEGGFVGAVQGMGNSVRRGGGAGGLVRGEGGPDGSERGLREGGLSVGLRGAAQAHGAAVSGSQSSAVGTGAGGVLSHHRYHQRTPSDPMPGAFELRPPAQSGGAPAGAAGVSGRQGGGVTGGEGVQGGQQGEMHGQQLMLGQQFEQGSQQQENGQQQLRPFHEAQRGMAQSESGRARSRRRRGVRRLDSGYALGYSSLTGPPPSLYERLRHLVYTSPYIDPDYVLTKLPPGQLPEIRALMLERLRRHREAISLYVHDLHSLSAAEAYCDRVYLQEQAQLPPHLRSLSQSSLAGVIKGGAPTTAAQPAPVGPSFDPASTHTLLRKPADIYLMLLQVVLAGTFYQPVDPAVSISQLPSLQLPTLEQGNSQQQPQQQPPQQQQQQQQQQEKHQQQQEGSRRGANEGEQGANAANAKKRREGGADKDGHGPLTLDERTWMQLAWILSRKCGRLDPLEVLDALPEDVPLAYVMPWLGAALGHCTEQSRNLAVVKHLRRSESLNLREAVGRAKQGHVHVSSERICCLCYKRIGPAVFVAYPDRTLAHYVCHQRREKGKGNK